MITTRRQPLVLLVNPWIADFAAYDFWSKPYGLLQLGAVLRQQGCRLQLIDCLDRHHPALGSWPVPTDKADGTGRFIREEISKPAPLRDVPRKYCRYGLPVSVVRGLLGAAEPPDAILLTSGMVYWYPAVEEMAGLLREYFPHTPLILGGWYATLAPEHAMKAIRPDHLVRGEGEGPCSRLIADIVGGMTPAKLSADLDLLPWPCFDLYPDLRSVAILTSRGCPYDCTFCASRILADGYRRRAPHRVLEEIRHWRDRHSIVQMAFFDDALLHRPEEYAKPLLTALAGDGKKVHFHTPNGLQPRWIDAEMAQLLHAAGFQSLRLSLESASPQRQKSMSFKVTAGELARAVRHLHDAGFARHQIGVYILMGLPDQSWEEVRESAQMAHDLKAGVFPAYFSPIPGTVEWQRAIGSGWWKEEDDLLLSNNSLFPIWRRRYGYDRCLEFTLWLKDLNQRGE